MSLVARHLEAHGIPTVIIGSALDIVQHCGVPRYLFTDFPLGNPCGHPWQRDMQKSIVGKALGMLMDTEAPGHIETVPYTWKDDPGWRSRYARVEPGDEARLFAIGEERRRKQASSKPTES